MNIKKRKINLLIGLLVLSVALLGWRYFQNQSLGSTVTENKSSLSGRFAAYSGSSDMNNGMALSACDESCVKNPTYNSCPPTACAGTPVTFIFHDGDHAHTHFYVNWRDTSTQHIYVYQKDLNFFRNARVTHTFANPGTYNIRAYSYFDLILVRFDNTTQGYPITIVSCTTQYNLKTIMDPSATNGSIKITPAPNAPSYTCSSSNCDANSSCTLAYNDGSAVSLTAQPAAGYQFDHWGGACTGSGGCNLTMSADKTVTAYFVPAPPSCTTSYTCSDPPFCGSSECDVTKEWTCTKTDSCGGSSLVPQSECIANGVNSCISRYCTCEEDSKWKEIAP